MSDAKEQIEHNLRALEIGALNPANFPHREHLRLGFEMLGRYSFCEAAARFARGLKLLTAKAGKPEFYHETKTVAFLAVLAERRARGGFSDWEAFIARNGDLLDKNCLERWYSAEELQSPSARENFILPQARR